MALDDIPILQEKKKVEKAQIIEHTTPENCIFCSMISGKVKALTVFEGNEFVGILDINPATKGHILLLPKRHIAKYEQLNKIELKELFYAISFITSKIREKYNASGFQIYLANGEKAGQRIDHLIFHIIPIYKTPAIPLDFKEYNSEETNKLASQFKTINSKK